VASRSELRSLAAAALVNQVKARFSNIPSAPIKFPPSILPIILRTPPHRRCMMRHNNNPMTRSLFPYYLHFRLQQSKRVLKPRIMLCIRLASPLSCVAGYAASDRNRLQSNTPKSYYHIPTHLYQHSAFPTQSNSGYRSQNSLKIISFLQSSDLRVASSAHCSR
jgi:hypothetical protein